MVPVSGQRGAFDFLGTSANLGIVLGSSSRSARSPDFSAPISGRFWALGSSLDPVIFDHEVSGNSVWGVFVTVSISVS